MGKFMNIITWIASALSCAGLIWVLLSILEITLFNLTTCEYSDWNLIKIILEACL